MVIPTLNRPERLRRCLRSVLAGERLPDEIVVCDQSGDDSTTQLLETEFSDKNSEFRIQNSEVGKQELEVERAASVTYLRLERPNASAARNAGLGAARSELVAFIDDDCVADRRWLAALVAEYEATSASERVAAVTGRVLPVMSGRNAVPVSSRVSGERRVYRAIRGGMQRGEWAPWDAGTGGNMLAPRSALLAVGGFDPALGPGTPSRAGEDVELLYRLSAHGALVYQPAAIVYHGAATRAGRLRSRYAYGTGMGSLLAKHIVAGDRTAQRLLILYLRHQLANVFRRGAWGPPEAALALAGAARALARRRSRQ